MLLSLYPVSFLTFFFLLFWYVCVLWLSNIVPYPSCLTIGLLGPSRRSREQLDRWLIHSLPCANWPSNVGMMIASTYCLVELIGNSLQVFFLMEALIYSQFFCLNFHRMWNSCGFCDFCFLVSRMPERRIPGQSCKPPKSMKLQIPNNTWIKPNNH